MDPKIKKLGIKLIVSKKLIKILVNLDGFFSSSSNIKSAKGIIAATEKINTNVSISKIKHNIKKFFLSLYIKSFKAEYNFLYINLV